MADAERVDETVEHDLTMVADCGEQIAHRDFAEAFLVFEFDFLVAIFECENIGRLLHPFLFEKQLDLLFAEAIDVEGAARGKELQMFDFLKWTRKLAAATGARTFLAGRGRLAHDIGMQWAWAFCREAIFLLSTRLVYDYVHNLRNDVAGALNNDGVADADVAALAQLLAVPADALDVILVVQCRVLHDHTADRDRLELRGRRERAGTADCDQNSLDARDRLLRWKLVRDRPARIPASEA